MLTEADIAKLEEMRQWAAAGAVPLSNFGEVALDKYADLLALAREGLAARKGGGIGLIVKERQRQIAAEGWTPKHDDEHGDGELALAAVGYATPEPQRTMRAERICPSRGKPFTVKVPQLWPWEVDSWKPSPEDRVRELVKAGALIAAEIDRLQRETEQSNKEAGR